MPRNSLRRASRDLKAICNPEKFSMFRKKHFSTGTDPLELWSGLFSISFIIHFISFILDPLISSTRYHLMLVIVCRRLSKYADINSSSSRVLTSCQLHDEALNLDFLSASWCTQNFHHIIIITHFTFSHISFFGFHMQALLFQWGKI